MSVARFTADQRTFYAVPHPFSCWLLAVSESWFYKWIKAPTTVRGERRALLDEAVRRAFRDSKGTYGSPRVYEDLIDPELPHPELVAGQGANVVPLPLQPTPVAAQGPVRDQQPTEVTSPDGPDLLARDWVLVGGRHAGLAGVGEHRGGLDAPARSEGPQAQAEPWPDPAGSNEREVPRPAEAGRYRHRSEPEVGRRHHGDPD